MTYDSIIKKSGIGSGNKNQTTESKKQNKKLPPHYGIDYSIYRDCKQYPVDPRKQCNQCVRPAAIPVGKWDLPSKYGKPHKDHEPGGCRCEKKKPNKHPSFSVYWPRPFSAKIDEKHPDRAAARYSPCQKKRLVDVFDPLSTLKLSSYQRRDNGFCGRGADPYGCVGESKRLAQLPVETGVRGIGYQFPSEPHSPGFDHPVDDPNLRIESSGYLK